LGNLKTSGFVRDVTADPKKPDIIVGYTAQYAIFVHENLEATHGGAYNTLHADDIANPNRKHTAASGNFARGTNQQAKFLERPMREERSKLLKIIGRGL
jgi:hypothetical protein